jgi:HSP20 family molecular chaperone IbpA
MAEPREIAKSQPREATPAEEEFRSPLVDIFESDDNVVLIADMPGVSDKSVEVTVEQDTLSLVGRMELAKVEGTRIYAEYASLPFRRLFTLSGDIRRDNIVGKMTNGVLRLTLHKADQAKVRKIPIKT